MDEEHAVISHSKNEAESSEEKWKPLFSRGSYEGSQQALSKLSANTMTATEGSLA